MSVVFSLQEAILVRAMAEQEQAIFERHGCSVSIYPKNATGEAPPGGHKVAFPGGCRLEEETPVKYRVLFPDGYSAKLLWYDSIYHLIADRADNGQLLP